MYPGTNKNFVINIEHAILLLIENSEIFNLLLGKVRNNSSKSK